MQRCLLFSLYEEGEEMKKQDVGIIIAVVAATLLFGYAILEGVQQSELSFQEKCDKMYGEGTWIRIGSQVLWRNGEAEYAGELSWDTCVPVDYLEKKLNDWKGGG